MGRRKMNTVKEHQMSRFLAKNMQSHRCSKNPRLLEADARHLDYLMTS